MADILTDEGLKSRLILAGLKELEEHGINDFSLRRVAMTAEVSCAAPYRHFKSKDELIIAIIEYVKEGWLLLSTQIGQVFADDITTKIKELCASGVRFWIANGKFRSVLSIGQYGADENRRAQMADFDAPILNAIDEYATARGLDKKRAELLKYSIPALLYGTVMLIAGGFISSQDAVENLKNKLDEELK